MRICHCYSIILRGASGYLARNIGYPAHASLLFKICGAHEQTDGPRGVAN